MALIKTSGIELIYVEADMQQANGVMGLKVEVESFTVVSCSPHFFHNSQRE